MKYCSHCGNEILDEAVICPKCGCQVEGMGLKEKTRKSSPNRDVLSYITMANVVILALVLLLANIFTIWVNYLSGFVMNIIALVFIVTLALLFIIDFIKGERKGLAGGWLACKLFALALALAASICWISVVASMMR